MVQVQLQIQNELLQLKPRAWCAEGHLLVLVTIDICIPKHEHLQMVGFQLLGHRLGLDLRRSGEKENYLETQASNIKIFHVLSSVFWRF